MAAAVCPRLFANARILRQLGVLPCRHSNTVPNAKVEKQRKSILSNTREKPERPPNVQAPRDYRHVYPDFLPEPDYRKRDRIREKLERRDMLRRRAVITIPEFYVGSIMAVTVSDPYAPNKKNRFIGICISRDKHGLRSTFILRNVVDKLGMEILYEMYSPSIQKIEVLRLEKRLDDHLFYLRDAPLEHSTFSFDMDSVPHPPGAPVPVNTVKIKLGPRPWHERWERQDLQGVEDLGLRQSFYDRAKEVSKPWEKHDLMKEYRERINEEEAAPIMNEVYKGIKEIEIKQRQKRGSLISEKDKDS